MSGSGLNQNENGECHLSGAEKEDDPDKIQMTKSDLKTTTVKYCSARATKKFS